MAKVRFMELVESVSGKYCHSNPNSVIFQRRKTCNVVCHIHNPYTGPATPEQVEQQTKFAQAQAAVAEVFGNPTELTAYTEAYKANPEGYASLRGYIFAKEYAKL